MFSSIPLVVLHISLLSISFIYPVLATSSSFQPILTTYASSVYIENKALYILGGNTYNKNHNNAPHQSSSTSEQTFMIDLSVSWNTKNPTIRELACGPNGSSMPSTLSSDYKNWFVVSNDNKGYLYDIDSNNWTEVLTIKNRVKGGSTAVTDPTTGLIYILDSSFSTTTPSKNNNNKNKNVNIINNNIWTVNITTKTVDKLKIGNNARGLISSTTTWSQSKKSIISFGNAGTSNGGKLTTFSPITASWRDLTTTGDVPSMRIGGCLASTSCGSSVVYFGGFTNGQGKTTAYSNIYILNTTTMVWKKGPDASNVNRRGGASCAISNNQFIAWGGSNSENSDDIQNSVLVYNLKSNQWSSSYKSSSHSNLVNITATTSAVTTSVVSPTPSLSNSNSTSLSANASLYGSSGHVVLLVIVLLAVVLFAIGGLVFYCVRKERKASNRYADEYYGHDPASSLTLNAAAIEFVEDTRTISEKDELDYLSVSSSISRSASTGVGVGRGVGGGVVGVGVGVGAGEESEAVPVDDDCSTLNDEEGSIAYPLPVMIRPENNSSFVSVTLSHKHLSTISMPSQSQVFAFPLPPSPDTMTLDAIQQHLEKHAHVVKSITSDKQEFSVNEEGKRHSHVGMKCVKTPSNNILEICYFPRPLSQHATLYDVYETLASSPAIPVM
ncbi:hypothetical protein BGZ46_009292 [Entomortierella lignicola]|nr:hypothetical protein BGZ46_009292 [Entomortierella lignicola]